MLVVWILLIFLASLLVLLAIPIELTFFVQRHEGRQEVSGSIRWLFGLVRLRVGDNKVRPRARPKRPRKKQVHRKRRNSRRIMTLFRTKGFGGRLLKLAQDLLQRIHIHQLSMEIRVGLDDPADTGRLWAIIGPFSAIVTLIPVSHIAIVPEFTGMAFEIDGKGHIRIIPIQLLFVMLIFILSPGTIRAWRTMRVA